VDLQHVFAPDARIFLQQVHQCLVEALLGLLAAVDSLGDGEDDEVVGARAAAEVTVEDHLAGLVLIDQLETVVGVHSQLLDERLVYGGRDAVEVVPGLAAR
jgi:hypothetical protein